MALQMAKKRESETFEIIVILAIVAIVAITGQVLIYLDSAERPTTSAFSAMKDGFTGFATLGLESQSAKPAISDVSIDRIETDPASPLVGEPFQIKAFVKNNGNTNLETPIYLSLGFQPMGDNAALEPVALQSVMPKILLPGEEAAVSFLVTAIIPEGPMRITALADSTGKIADANPANNELSRTIIVAIE
jgi:hypothetical protein